MEDLLRNEIEMVLSSYMSDPADTPYQRGYLAAFLDLNKNLNVVDLNDIKEALLRAQCVEPRR